VEETKGGEERERGQGRERGEMRIEACVGADESTVDVEGSLEDQRRRKSRREWN
jgi:hypothetical protein